MILNLVIISNPDVFLNQISIHSVSILIKLGTHYRLTNKAQVGLFMVEGINDRKYLNLIFNELYSRQNLFIPKFYSEGLHQKCCFLIRQHNQWRNLYRENIIMANYMGYILSAKYRKPCHNLADVIIIASSEKLNLYTSTTFQNDNPCSSWHLF